MSNPQPSDELLDNIAEIALMKRDLSREQRALSSRGGLYVSANELSDGKTLVKAGSRSIFAKLIFYVHPDGRKEVKKYQSGEWESKVDDTLDLTRAFSRAANWTVPPSKQDEYYAYEKADWEDPKWKVAYDAWMKARAGHEAEIFAQKLDQVAEERVKEAFFGTLREEWPVEYLEILSDVRGNKVAIEQAFQNMGACYMAGYAVGNGWLSPEHLDNLLIDFGGVIADLIRQTSQGARSRRYPFVQALREVSALGIAASRGSTG